MGTRRTVRNTENKEHRLTIFDFRSEHKNEQSIWVQDTESITEWRLDSLYGQVGNLGTVRNTENKEHRLTIFDFRNEYKIE
ncbi:MAG: hypothetical protein ISS16_11950 [Ignavibacteria bacterium]|nr:hypothetical protein [Ignavibacteria bacterium]